MMEADIQEVYGSHLNGVMLRVDFIAQTSCILLLKYDLEDGGRLADWVITDVLRMELREELACEVLFDKSLKQIAVVYSDLQPYTDEFNLIVSYFESKYQTWKALS